MNRHIDFEGIENFRDFGGYATRCGRGVRSGRLYRSAQPARATESDFERLKALGIEVVVDLRRTMEREREPCRHETFARTVIANDLGDQTEAWAEVLRREDPTADFFRNDCRAFYRAAPFEDRHVDLFRRWFAALATVEGAVLVHCAAGKDRTGMVCALTHHIAGVHQDDIVADYLLTNDEARIVRRIPLVADVVEAISGKRPTDEAMRVGCSVEAEYLQIAFDRMVEDCGSIDGYLEQALGVDAPLRERIAENILG